MEKKITDVLGDMDGLAEAISGKLKEVKTELSMVKLAFNDDQDQGAGAKGICCRTKLQKVGEFLMGYGAVFPSCQDSGC
ncbi:unnamed protein product [Prunus armeniaca]